MISVPPSIEEVPGEAAARASHGPAPSDPPPIADAVGLTVDAFPDRESWEQLGRDIAAVTSSHQWIIGDWALYGEREWGFDLPLADISGLDCETIRGARYVASRFERVRRRTTLSFAHHREVASLTPHQADVLLNRAEAESLSVRALRELAVPRRPVAALDQRTEILAGILRDEKGVRKVLAGIPGADRVRVAHEKYVLELEALAGQRTTTAAPLVLDEDRADLADMRIGRYGRRV